MSANDDFPRGWVYTAAPASNVAASITLPGVGNVARILTGFSAKAIGGGGAWGLFYIQVTSSDGAYTNLDIGAIGTTAAGTDEDSASGLQLAASPGSALTVALSGAAGVTQILSIYGYDA